ncbi:hypothetical protein D3Z52_14240 [Clostridiaceae bacterium]|nr:hypothetical protein [Clostridiaceae bacterium]
MFCLPPPFPPVTTRSAFGAGGLTTAARPPISRRAPFLCGCAVSPAAAKKARRALRCPYALAVSLRLVEMLRLWAFFLSFFVCLAEK